MTDWLDEAEAACAMVRRAEKSLKRGSEGHARVIERRDSIARTVLPRAIAVLRAADELDRAVQGIADDRLSIADALTAYRAARHGDVG